jgi:mono/diheme cytochrome c family protein
MKRLLIVPLILAVAVAAAGETSFGDPSRGQRLFVEKGCVQCHAVRGAGGRLGPDLGRSSAKDSFHELFASMWNHSGAMDAKMTESRLIRPKFNGDELSDLLTFLYFLNYFDEPGDVKRGKTLFAEKHCIDCHAIGRVGGAMGPRLDTLARGTPPLQIAQDLWNHGPVMIAAMRARNVQLPTFKEKEIIDLFAYLRNQGTRQAAREFRSAGDPENGKRVFAEKGCRRCHALMGDGAAIGPDLGTSELRGSVTQLAGRMWNHWPAMAGAMSSLGMSTPVFKDEQLADLFAYVFISRYGATAGSADGASVYIRSGCASCHGIRGEGAIGPALASVTRGESKERIAQRMWNHAPAMRTQMGDRRVIWPRFRAAELAALIRYLSDGFPAQPVAKK